MWIIDVGNIIPGILGGIFMLFIDGLGLISFEIYLFVHPKGRARIKGGIAVIVISVLSAILMYALTNFVFVFAGYWRWTLITILAMNFVYIVITVLIMKGKIYE